MHIATSAVFLMTPGLLAWGVDWAWRQWLDPASAPTLQQLLPTWAASGAGGGGGKGGKGHDQTAAMARALAVLKASGQDASEGAGGAEAAAATMQPRSGSQLRPFVELAYGACEQRLRPSLMCLLMRRSLCSRLPPLQAMHPQPVLHPSLTPHYVSHLPAWDTPGIPPAGYLPMVYTAILAYYLDNAFEEAGLILPVRSPGRGTLVA